MADADKDLSNYRSALEREANRFAGELLYPEKCIDRDFKYALDNALDGSGIQLVTISRPTAYGEYAPYRFVHSEEEFAAQVLAMRA